MLILSHGRTDGPTSYYYILFWSKLKTVSPKENFQEKTGPNIQKFEDVVPDLGVLVQMFAKADIANPGTMVVSPTDAIALQSRKVNSQALADSVEQLTAFVSHHCSH